MNDNDCFIGDGNIFAKYIGNNCVWNIGVILQFDIDGLTEHGSLTLALHLLGPF